MKISNSSEFSAKESKVKKCHVKYYGQLYGGIAGCYAFCQRLICSDRLRK
jgi:hypothetical protein